MFIVMVVTTAMNDDGLKIQYVQGFVRYSVNSLNYMEDFFHIILICSYVLKSIGACTKLTLAFFN